MELVNGTGLDALNFEAMDQAGSLFEVVAVKVGYAIGSDGRLTALPDPVPLATEDEAFGELNAASVRWESDLAPFKPLCDVLVNATAHAPQGATRRFEVGLKFTRPERAGVPDLSPSPQGLNPWMAPSDVAMVEWRKACERVASKPIPAEDVIVKVLTVVGPRHLRKKLLPVRVFWGVIGLATLGLIRRNPWKLTRSGRVESLPVRYELACGGESKVLSMEKFCRRLKQRHWLPGINPHLVRMGVASGEQDQPVAHASHPWNHLGAGFAALWFLKASRIKRLAAPQVERTGAPFTARIFWKQARGKKKAGLPAEGLGSVCRTWHPRLSLVGTPEYPDTFDEEEFPGLPEDFDFRFWNCAPDDQQVPYPEGGETLELYNLCSPNHPASERVAGNTLLRLELPKDRPFLVVKDGAGCFGAKPLNLDTVIVEPEEGRVLLTYRAVMPKTADLLWANLKVQRPSEPDQLGAALALMEKAEEAHGA